MPPISNSNISAVGATRRAADSPRWLLFGFGAGAADDEKEEDVSPWEAQRSVKIKMETQQKRHPGITKAENGRLFNPLILLAVELKDFV